MRKHKSVVAILLAVMMIFTFMPAMSFADSTAEGWNADYTVYTDSAGYQWGSTVKFVESPTQFQPRARGVLEATPTTLLNPKVGETPTAPVGKEAYFYDFDNAVLLLNGVELTGKTWTYSAFDTAFNNPTYTVKFSNARYVEKDVDPTTVEVPIDRLMGWDITVTPSEFKEKSVVAQTVEFVASLVMDGNNVEQTGTALRPSQTGTLAKGTANVEAYVYSAKDAKWVLDGETDININYGTYRTTYDGVEHTLAVVDTGAVKASYGILNRSTGQFDPVDSVTYKNYTGATNERPQYKATLKDAEGNDKTAEAPNNVRNALTVRVDQADDVTLAFDTDPAIADLKVAPGYDAWDYVKVSGGGDAAKVEAEQLLAYFKAAYDIKIEVNKYDATKLTWTIDPKENKEDIDKEYADLTNNYEYVGLASSNTSRNAVLVDAPKDPTDPSLATEVEFTNSPTVKSYSYKKVLKKKSKSFTVKAAADNGAVLNYKLINAPAKITINKTSGKITVKKGLKKGTYKIKVKAYVKGNSAVSETHAITIKVKK